ncbi:iron hydrogenase [Anaeramoeba ignava]|uniref:Complex I-75kD n=1 Tax=Anaeramoeba ignava TaxID=1746090 RepID=A0A9Q0RAZ9_ANAIG|nr:iron hydrogenase [Anaeramoeba ignava]
MLTAKHFTKQEILSKIPIFKQALTTTMKNTVVFKINDKLCEAEKGTTIIEACRKYGVPVPTLCYHPMLPPVGKCRLCLVDINNSGKLSPACTTPVAQDMEIQTNTPRVINTVKTNLELLLSSHPQECTGCESSGRCELQKLAYIYDIKGKFGGKMNENREAVDRSSPSVLRDMEKCVMCGRCVRACSVLQGMNILGFAGRGDTSVPETAFGLPIGTTTCINCGQCSFYCPVGAITENSCVREVHNILKNKDGRIVVFQTAPATRVAISEEFGMEPGTISTGKLAAALRELGADAVFDTNFTADLTILEEGSELLDRVANKGVLPMFTSCCPAWINMVEKLYPELIPNLSSARSPQGMMGSLIKRYWAQKMGVDPKKIVSVSVMPCTAKKDEITRPQLTLDDGTPETDFVLTTRELGKLIKLNNIPFASLKEIPHDDPLGESTGAADIFANTGGVMEAALRTAYEIGTGSPLPTMHFTPVRGFDSMKEAHIDFNGIDFKVAVVHGAANIHKYIEKMKKGEVSHHFVEFMVCKGGCIGGGGEPKSISADYLLKRMNGIYKIDDTKEMKKSHVNPSIQRLYKFFLEKPLSHKSHKLLHTHYKDRSTNFNK